MPGIFSPANAFGAQTRQYEWLSSPKPFQSRLMFIRSFQIKSLDEARTVDTNNLTGPPQTQEEVDAVLAQMGAEARLFRDGVPVFVTSEALDLVDEAVEEMPSEVLLEQDLPYPAFVLWLERPHTYHPQVIGHDGEIVQESWDIVAVAIEGTQNVQVRGIDADGEEGEEGEYTTRGAIATLYIAQGDIPERMHAQPDMVGPFPLIDLLGMAFDVDWSDRPIDGPARQLHKWLIALFRLMGEHIELTQGSVARPLLRSAVRAGRMPPKDGYLTLLHLRKGSYDGEPGESDEARKLRWKHRVRGHWQRFFCPSRGYPVGDERAYRHRYVNSYVRGPGDLIDSHQVVVVD